MRADGLSTSVSATDRQEAPGVERGSGNDCAVKNVTFASDSRLSILTAEHAITGAAAELWIMDQPGRRAGDDDPDPDLRPSQWATRSAEITTRACHVC